MLKRLRGTDNLLPEVPVSVQKIEDMLLDMDVKSVTKEMDDEDVASIYFVIPGKKDIAYRLPVFVDEIERTMKDDYKTLDRKKKYDIREQARRLAWCELANYIEAISTMVKLKQTTLSEACLPFTYDQTKDKTFYQMLEEGKINYLKDGS